MRRAIDENRLKIQEAESFTNDILSKEPDDYKVFSPRKVEDMYREELNSSSYKKDKLSVENEQLIEKLDRLDSIISTFEILMDERNSESGNASRETILKNANLGESTYSKFHNILDSFFYENLKVYKEEAVGIRDDLMRKTDLIQNYILQDPQRAKIELQTLRSSYNEIALLFDGLVKHNIDFSKEDITIDFVLDELKRTSEDIYHTELDLEVEDKCLEFLSDHHLDLCFLFKLCKYFLDMICENYYLCNHLTFKIGSDHDDLSIAITHGLDFFKVEECHLDILEKRGFCNFEVAEDNLSFKVTISCV